MPETDLPQARYADLWSTFGRIGLLSFGGPAGQIALMHRMLVEDKRWIEEDAYLRALNFCTLLPGPEAQQLAIYVGWRLKGLAGGLIGGLLFVIPGALVILALSILYAYAADLSWVAAAFLGIKAAVLAIIVEALLRVSRRALKGWLKPLIAVLAFLALFVLKAPFPLVVIGAGVIGFIVAGVRPDLLKLKPLAPSMSPLPPLKGVVLTSLGAAVAWAALWAAPMVLIAVFLGPQHVLFAIGGFFARLAAVTFGGAYAVLAYMAQEAVSLHGWLKPGEMADGLGLAETTPGPLILVTEFVGFLAAFRTPAPFTPLLAGVMGAAVTLWMTFAPCFLWIFSLAPFIERLERAPRVQGALAAVTAAVVGVIANLSVWFALHVLFARFTSNALFALWPAGSLHQLTISLPDPSSFQWAAAGLAALGAVLLFRLHAGVVRTLGACLAAVVGLHALGAA